MSHFARSLGCWLVLVVASLAWGEQSLLSHIPANAKLVVFIKDMAALEKNLQAFAGKLDLPVDPSLIELDSLTVLAGLPVELGKQAALVVTDVSPQGLIILIELANPKEAVKLPGLTKLEEEDDDDANEEKEEEDEEEDDEDEDQEFTAEIMGVPAVIEVEGNLAKIQLGVTDDEGMEAVEEVENPLSKALTNHHRETLEKSDLFFWVNVVEWRPLASQGLDLLSQNMQAAFDQAGAPAQMPMGMDLNAYFRFLFDGAKTITNETRTFYGGLAFDEMNAHLLLAADYEPDSGMEKSFKPASVPLSDLLTGLADQDYLMAGGAKMESFRQPMTAFAEGVTKSMFEKNNPDLLKGLEASYAYLKETDALSMLFDMGGPAGFQGVGQMTSARPSALFDQLKKASESAGNQLAFLGGGNQKLEIKSTTFEGQPAFEYEVDMKQTVPGLEDQAAQEASAKALEAIYGPNLKLHYQVGLAKDGVRYATAPQENPLSLLTNKKELKESPLIKRTLEALPNQGAMVGMVHPLGFVRFFGSMMAAQGVPIPLPEGQEQVPPIGFAIEVKKGMTSMDLAVPAETAKAIVTFAMQAAQGFAPPAGEEEEGAQPPAEDADANNEEEESAVP